MTPQRRAAVETADLSPAAPPAPLAAPVASGAGTPSSPSLPLNTVPRRAAAGISSPAGVALNADDATLAGSNLSAGQRAIAAAMSEDRGPGSLDAHVVRLVADLGLWSMHIRNPIGSQKGWPDRTILGCWIMHRELKSMRGKLTGEQRAVGDLILAAGGDWDVWTPADLLTGRIQRELAALAGLAGAA